jgi:hypothetical protein
MATPPDTMAASYELPQSRRWACASDCSSPIMPAATAIWPAKENRVPKFFRISTRIVNETRLLELELSVIWSICTSV